MQRLRSARTVRNIGVLLGLAICLGLLVAVMQDRASRIEAAQRQSLALATGADRLVHYELRNLERAMTGIAADADAYAQTVPTEAGTLLSDAIDGVVSRHAELESIGLYDPKGNPLTRIAPDPTLPTWVGNAERSVPPQRLLFGKLQALNDGSWVVPMALQTRAGNYLVAKLRTSELHNMVERLDTGRDGSVGVLDRDGVVLARSSSSRAYVGRKVPLPATLKTGGTDTLQLTSKLDHVTRLSSFSEVSGYPLVIGAGLGLQEALGPWRRFALISGTLALLYWLGLVYLVRRMNAAESMGESMLDELEAQEDWLRQAQLAARSGVWRIVPETDDVQASAQAAGLFGFPAMAAIIPVQQFFDRMHDEDRARVMEEFGRARDAGSPFHSEYRILLPEGGERWISARGAVVTDGRGVERMTGTIVDITDRRDAQARMEGAQQQFRELFERNPLPFWVYDAQTLRFLAVNATAVRHYGYSHAEFMEMSILDIRPTADRDAVLYSVQAAEPHGEPERVWHHVTRDGRTLSVRIHSSDIQFDGRAARLVLAEDVSAQVAYERDLAWRATHDAMTGLLTLPALIERLDESPPPEGRYAVAYVHLRDLDLIAPTLGRRAGEAILREAAQRFSRVAMAFGYVAYVPAESFVVVALDARRAQAMADALADAISEPVRSEGGTHSLEAWIGTAQGPMEGETAENVVGHAALAVMAARREHAPAVGYDASMAEQAGMRMALVGRLRQALERGEFELFYQPIHRLSDGRVTAMEALLRWRQPDGGFVPPMQFIPLCEESGLIVPIGGWVLEEAARAHARLAQHGMDEVAIAVNVSAVQFLSDSLADAMRSLRRRHGLPRHAVHLELTESVVLRRPERARDLMDELQQEGVRLSIDDFGTGFSSMAYLRDLPLDYLKVDRTFVHDVDRDERNASICRALIALGHGLGLGIIAEGVETAAQLEWLRAHGCDQVQGYYLGRPAPLDELLVTLRRAA